MAKRRNPEKITDMSVLKEYLRQFTGSETIYKGGPFFPVFVYTQGVKWLADAVGAYWLIDLIFSYQTKQFRIKYPFQIWTIKAKGSRGIAECREDTDAPIIARQSFSTDFPEGELKLYFIEGTLLLPSEY